MCLIPWITYHSAKLQHSLSYAAGGNPVLLTHGGWHAAAEMGFSSDESSGRRYDASSVSSEFEEADLLQPQRSDLFGFLAMDCVLLPIIPEVCPSLSPDVIPRAYTEEVGRSLYCTPMAVIAIARLPCILKRRHHIYIVAYNTAFPRLIGVCSVTGA